MFYSVDILFSFTQHLVVSYSADWTHSPHTTAYHCWTETLL